MDAQTKSAIKTLVLDLRHTLEEELTIALKRYGIASDRADALDAPPDRLRAPEDRAIWRRIATVVRQGTREGRSLPQASADYVREAAFTFLNRLVGLKCLEVRGIVPEIITTRDIYGGRSQAHRDYRDAHPAEARAPDDALPAALAAACRRVNEDLIGYLFDPDDDYSLIWPRYPVLKRCIGWINALPEAAWREDEIIGWLYQFYNAEEKVAVRRRGKPQTPHDVAVINQFFTPRWIVKFLVDNTLGRLWLEMHPDSPRVRAKCDYLVPEPKDNAEAQRRRGAEGKLKNYGCPGQAEQRGDNAEAQRRGDAEEKIKNYGNPVNPVKSFALDPTSPVNDPGAEARREEKPVTEIRLLDPACGTMHFGHYAMEVFDAMYRDARDWGHVRIADAEIPGAILQHNLFGVDIDRRAVQLAALSLFMKARTMHPEARVRQVNLVAADATLPDGDVKARFLQRYAHDPAVRDAFAQVLEDMDQVAELGSLLRVEERLRELLARAGHAAAMGAFAPRGQGELPGLAPPTRQLGLAEMAEDEAQATALTPHYTLQELREDLRTFARRALDEHDLNAQLFATEADKAVRLLDVLMSTYDVVMMNPPYGYTTSTAGDYLRKAYPSTKRDLYAAFYERAVDLIKDEGFAAALTSRTFMSLSTFKKLRKKILLKRVRPVAFLDLGFGILDDATVATCATVFSAETPKPKSFNQLPYTSFRLIEYEDDRKQHFEKSLNNLKENIDHNNIFFASIDDLRMLPDAPLAYWISHNLRKVFIEHTSLEDQATIKAGLCTGADAAFIRYWWEIPTVISPRNWQTFTKGGDYCKYYYDVDLLVDWTNEGKAMLKWPGARLQNTQYYFVEAVNYVYVTIKGFNARYLPPGHIFGHASRSVIFENPEMIWPALGILNSSLVQFFLSLLTDGRKYETGYVSNLPFIDQFEEYGSIDELAQLSHNLKSAWDTGNEICTRFTQPWLLQLAQPGGEGFAQGLGRVLALLGDAAPPLPAPPSTLDAVLDSMLDGVRAIEKAADARLQALQAEIDEAVYDLYAISAEDRALIERELGDRPPELVWPHMEGKADRAKREAHVQRLFAHYARQAVREDEDGIVPLAGCAARAPYLMDRVRAKLEAQFGPQAAYDLEQAAADYIGRDVETWLHTYFFHHFHVGLYKKRPVLWHLTSDKKTFAVMLDYHRLTRDTLPKVRAQYLWPQVEEVRTRLEAARAEEGPLSRIGDLEEELADLEAFNQRLESVIQGTVKVRLPTWAVGPYREGQPPYDPDLDDGVRVNLLPIQKARLLPVKRVV